MIAWFRSKRQLLDRNTELAAIVAKQIDELAALRAEMDEGWQRATATENRLMRQRDDIRRSLGEQIRTQAATIAAQAERLNAVAEELRSLRDDIARMEQAEAEAKSWLPVRGFGMARPIDTPAVQDAMRRRRERQVNAVFGIAEDEAAAKRQADGEGDE